MDDDVYTLRLFSKILRKMDIDVFEAGTIAVARQLIQDQDFDLFLCDINMGCERGTDLVEEMRKRLSNTHIVFISAYSQYSVLVEDFGIDLFLQKPVSIRTLQDLVKELL
jgi:DNA-binding response OmpR family regulator